MDMIVIKKDGSEYSFNNVKNNYVQNGKLLVIEFYRSVTELSELMTVKFPIEDVDQAQEWSEASQRVKDEAEEEISERKRMAEALGA